MSKTETEGLKEFNDKFVVAGEARKPFEEWAINGYKQYWGILTERTDKRRQRLTTLNINMTAEAIDSMARQCTKFVLRGEDRFKLEPQAPDDEEGARVIAPYLKYKMGEIPGIGEAFRRVFLQAGICGIGPGRLRYERAKRQWFFDWIYFFNWWVDPASSIENIEYFIERIEMKENMLKQYATQDKYQNVDQYIKLAQPSPSSDARKEVAAVVETPLPEGKEKIYDIMLYWYKTEKDKWEVKTIGALNKGDSYEGITILRNNQSPYWFGQPYCLGLYDIDPISIIPQADARKIRGYQRTLTMIYDHALDFIYKRLVPPTLVNVNQFESEDEMYNIENPELTSIIKVKDTTNAAKQLETNPLPSEIPLFIQDMMLLIERRLGNRGVLSGEQAARREPAFTTQARTQLASEVYQDKLWVMGESFYKPFLRKFMVGMQQFWDEKDFIRFSGEEGASWLSRGKVRESALEPLVWGTEFRFGASKEEAVKHFDIIPVPEWEAESKEMIKKNAVDITQMLMAIGQIAPQELQGLDLDYVIAQYLEACGVKGGQKILFPQDVLPPDLNRAFARLLKNRPQELIKALEGAGLIPIAQTETETEPSKKGMGTRMLERPGTPVYQRPEGIAEESDTYREATQEGNIGL